MTAIPTLKHVVSEAEWQVRVDLAACYRLVAMYGMTDLIATHISAKLPAEATGGEEQFLINPYGMLFDEITASSLLRVDLHGNVLSESPYGFNQAGFVIHSTIHEARPEVHCVVHTHTRAGVAVSAQRHGLLPISQQATLVLQSLAYHDYEGLAVHDDERQRLKDDLGNANYFMLRNHGLLTAARTIPDAFWAMYLFETTCQIQIAAQSGGGPLIQVEQRVLDGVPDAARKMGSTPAGQRAWPALLRKLDRLNPGYDA
ncbi:class II aldolase/adducin family protein [Verticiella sediminum]|uniref:Class II aldolase/adducin family protein n=1 Tax=Verticiella sediminum TaxID=1247510 RepID=A0A556AJC3_9BURK|nr:class II aldolase/adducin family protein [Verticiella sediminum]TSH92969.1 class II aldolase/adducin family protein [Verticiella sediminum]